MEIDSFGMFHMSTAAFPHLKRTYESQGDANILNITAISEPSTIFFKYTNEAEEKWTIQ